MSSPRTLSAAARRILVSEAAALREHARKLRTELALTEWKAGALEGALRELEAADVAEAARPELELARMVDDGCPNVERRR